VITTLRRRALAVLLESDPATKALRASSLPATGFTGADDDLIEPPGVPGRPERPQLVPHTELKQRSLKTPEGHAALLHAVAHIEMNAINLAADAVWRFAGMPDDYYREWAQVAREEAYHFGLLAAHLNDLGYAYGRFPAHNSLWEMAERTKHDVLARMALVPRTLEARGLDASPPMRAKLSSIGDKRGTEILDIILRDEIGHVAVGNRWYAHLCEQRGVDPVATYEELAKKYGAPRLRGPFNLAARRAAGFSEIELEKLSEPRN
jgi:uncharacterized ferritin-like protein (DUF455 family)